MPTSSISGSIVSRIGTGHALEARLLCSKDTFLTALWDSARPSGEHSHHGRAKLIILYLTFLSTFLPSKVLSQPLASSSSAGVTTRGQLTSLHNSARALRARDMAKSKRTSGVSTRSDQHRRRGSASSDGSVARPHLTEDFGSSSSSDDDFFSDWTARSPDGRTSISVQSLEECAVSSEDDSDDPRDHSSSTKQKRSATARVRRSERLRVTAATRTTEGQCSALRRSQPSKRSPKFKVRTPVHPEPCEY